jgi:hypothetical protein
MGRGLRQAAVLLATLGAGAAVGAGAWTLLADGSYRVALAVALMIAGGLLALTGGNAFSRAGSMDAFAFLGMGPEHEDPHAGEGLTNLGIFLFVGLPLIVAGGLLYGTG